MVLSFFISLNLTMTLRSVDYYTKLIDGETEAQGGCKWVVGRGKTWAFLTLKPKSLHSSFGSILSMSEFEMPYTYLSFTTSPHFTGEKNEAKKGKQNWGIMWGGSFITLFLLMG